jgi:formylglycine-generating enzyme required for sulfatase activity
MRDAAGNVFQWTSTPWEHEPNAMTVKGSAWDDYAGVGRAASAHGRPRSARHAIVGLRCAGG